MKTNKHQTLILVHTKGGIQAKDLVQQFGYSPGTARSYLSYLKRQDLLARTGQGHVLTERGGARLQYFDVAGCGHPICPLCDQKAGQFTCPRCGYQLPVKDARIWPEQDFLVLVRHAWVYCPPVPEAALDGGAGPVTQDSTEEGTMKTVGWEIRPLGWFLVLVVLVVLGYFVVKWVHRWPPAPEQ